ncbi:DUF4136 domain-containing protein [Tenacibaculum insulae]|uniref:DUF4136 domain-containing protein n=1 Tax=Tenacibaculum insulae TaxID=2029677 RepID=UPI003AB285CE
MKQLKYLVLIFIVACSSSKVIYDYDETTNFNKYKTFNFFEDVGKGISQLNIKRITDKITENLESKGMRFSENPDIYINVISNKKASTKRSKIGIGLGTGGRNIGFGISGGIPIESKKINEELLIDFVESKENKLIWQGISNNEVHEKSSPEEKRIYYKEVINKTLVNYPPKKTSKN